LLSAFPPREAPRQITGVSSVRVKISCCTQKGPILLERLPPMRTSVAVCNANDGQREVISAVESEMRILNAQGR